MSLVPTIDIGSLLSISQDEVTLNQTLEQIDFASKKFGFFNIINHGVPDLLVQRLDMVARRYFDLPIEVKAAGPRSQTNMRGFFDGEYTKNLRDWKQGFDWGSQENELDGKNLWPENEIEFKETLEEYWNAMAKLSAILLKAFCLLLGVPGDYLVKYFEDPHPSWARLNYYPPCPGLTTELGVNPHRDACCLTVLKQDDSVSGLQIYLNNGNEAAGDGLSYTDPNWIDVPPIKGAFTVNLGEALQVWSNDKYFAAMHRALAKSDSARYSVPFFYMPTYSTDIVPILGGEKDKPKYRTLNWGEYRSKRNKGDYDKLDFSQQGRLPNWRIVESTE